MTIEERLERLTGRHEALTQSVELLAENGKATDKRIEALLAASAQDAENIRALARIAALHERRLTDLEGGSRPRRRRFEIGRQVGCRAGQWEARRAPAIKRKALPLRRHDGRVCGCALPLLLVPRHLIRV
jgi:hypothetical protein